ncbi:unannotated protein [freshwater metagenome]|uniref:Unannotated protein n=1 Tax=freshwater metagenome TaxID=449393 RepID=A0A6J7I5R0_9ZZZZ
MADVFPPSLVRFRAALEGALEHLEARRSEINDLNVFPVADGDTGDNMALTLSACLAEVDRLAREAGSRPLEEIGREEIVDSVARAALLGARGNSGVILSQLIRGAAEELISRPGELVDPMLVGSAMARAAQRAYASVRRPAEGTMLTVMRDMAVAVASEVAHGEWRLPPGADPQEQDRRIADILERAVEAGEESVRRSPDLLPALRDAGVVDAGAYGVVVLLAGCVAALRGDGAPTVAHHRHVPTLVEVSDHESSTFRYCTNFAVTARPGVELDPPAAHERRIEELGDSVLVVGDHATLRVHVHTDDPDAVVALFAQLGDIVQRDVADMHQQVTERRRRIEQAVDVPDARCAALAVVSGSGLAAHCAACGAATLDGGPTLNPSTEELLAAIERLPAGEVVVLPNSRNVVMAAQAAADLASKTVVVVPCHEQQTAVSALLAFSPDASAQENADALSAALAEVRTGQIAPAARADAQGRFALGDAVGYVGEELVAWGDPTATLTSVLAQLAQGAEQVTLFRGEGAPLGEDDVAALAPAGIDIEQLAGGQPGRWWLLSAE